MKKNNLYSDKKYDWLNLEPTIERYSKLLMWQKDIVDIFNPNVFGISKQNLSKFIYSVVKEQDLNEVTNCRPYDHTMSFAIDKYVKQKLPYEAIKKNLFLGSKIEIHGIYPSEVTEIARFYNYIIKKTLKFNHNPTTKKFNFERPTFHLATNNKGKDIILVTTVPGRDYVLHYGSLLRHYLCTLTSNHKNTISIYRYPFAERSITYWTKLDNTFVQKDDIVILGYVAELTEYFKKNTEWSFNDTNENEFYHSSTFVTLRGNKINLLGVKYTFWGNISAKISYQILSLGAKEIIYCGKLGSLMNSEDIYKKIFCPSKYAIMYHDKLIGRIEDLQHPVHKLFPEIDTGYHVSVPTVLEEDYVQREITAELQINSIDNEISQMAFATSRYNKEYNDNKKFCSIHFATDYIRKPDERNKKTEFDLSNNRSNTAKKKKEEILNKVAKLLVQYL